MAWCARRLLAFGPRVVALLVLIAAMVVAPLALPAAPEPCCCPVRAKCTCAEHRDANREQPTVRRCGSPVAQSAPLPAPPAALPAAIAIVSDVAAAPAVVATLPVPHASPDLERPRAPG